MSHSMTDLEPDLFDGYVRGWSKERMDRIQQVLAGDPVRPTEPMITDLLAAAQGDLGDDVIRIFLDAVGREGQSTDGLILATGAEFKRWYPGSCGHVPDIVVCERETWDPVIIVEGKMFAWVNGGRGYCRQDADVYSNQVIAYVQGCWTTTPLDDASFLWIGPDAYLGHEYGPWARRALGPDDHEDPRYPDVDPGAWARQEWARTRWDGLAWEDLASRLGPGPSSQATAHLIEVWARA